MRQIPTNSGAPLTPIFLITFLDQIAITICFPVLTFICFDKHSALFTPNTSQAIRSYWFGILSAIPHLVPIIAAPILGILSDKLGRKKILIFGAFGIILYGLFASASIIYSTIILLVIGYLISGICVRTEPIALAVVSDCSTHKKRFKNIGLLQFCIAVGATIGPLIGGYLTQRFFFNTINFSLPYLTSAIIGIITVIITITVFKETNTQDKQERNYFILNKNIFRLITLLLITQISWRIYYQFTPPLLKIMAHYSSTEIGLFMATIAIWLALASSLVIKILNYFFNERQILIFSISAMLVGLLLVITTFYTHKNIIIWLSAIPIATGDVIIYSLISATMLNSVSKNDYGKIMGLNFIIVSLTWSLTGLIGGYLFALDIKLPIFIALIILGTAQLLSNKFRCQLTL